MHASELVARIGGGDKSNNQLDDDGERGWGSGRKRQRQQQHGRALAVDFGNMANDDEGTTEATVEATLSLHESSSWTRRSASN